MFDNRPFTVVIHVSRWAICGVYSCLTVDRLRQLHSDLVVAITYLSCVKLN